MDRDKICLCRFKAKAPISSNLPSFLGERFDSPSESFGTILVGYSPPGFQAQTLKFTSKLTC